MGPLILIQSQTGFRPGIGQMPGYVRIRGSVGTGGHNQPGDVQAVQAVLNAASRSLGGPLTALAVDGIVGPKTIHAIRQIQSAWTRVIDGRVDPGGPTIRVLNRLAGLVPPLSSDTRTTAVSTPSPAVGYAPASGLALSPAELSAQQRLNDAQTRLMPLVVVAIIEALDILAKSQQYLGPLGSGRRPSGAELRSEARLTFLFVAKHFRLHESDPFGSLSAAQQVTACFARMCEAIRSRTVSTPAGPRFDRLYALPIVPSHVVNVTDLAYVGEASGSMRPGVPDGYSVPDPVTQKTMPEVCDGVYLLPRFDSMGPLQTSILIHELAHLSGGLGRDSVVLDFYNDRQLDAQPRAQHLINVRCYELFATELLWSTATAATMYQPPETGCFARLPSTTGGERIVAPSAPPSGPDPIAYPAGFA